MKDDLFIEMEYAQLTKEGQAACGDNVQLLTLEKENRSIAALSDGLGSGVKASVLANMTTTMAVRFLQSDLDLLQAVEIIMDSLPICEVRKISYATFSLMDFRYGGTAKIIEMGNPEYIHLRGTREVPPVFEEKIVSKHWPDREVRRCEINLEPGDRVVLCSDGVTQAGLGSGVREYRFGWRRAGLLDFVQERIQSAPDISSAQLARCIVNKARSIPPGKCLDDTTALVIYLRKPRVLRILTGPPYYKESDSEYAHLANLGFEHVIVCGGTTANILERILGVPVTMDISAFRNSGGLPPPSVIKGIALATEGILTLSKVETALESGKLTGQPAAVQAILNRMMEHDRIEFAVGTKVNESHQDPSVPQDLELRRSVVRRIASLLEHKHRKATTINFY
ncbi:MAG: SpoIIE family protein phosphatase [Victivallales bacterium]|nr:SpoIIE family protein phosphatase [Victivallales bacterium]